MVYYNADGNESTMCGNGGRCLVSFAHFLNIFEDKTNFMAIDGLHEAEVNGDLVKLKMIDVENIDTFSEYTVMNTGSPHYVAFVEHVEDMDVYLEGKK
jgi:diaminopimelate epimerase